MSTTIQTGQFAPLPNGTRLHYASAGPSGKPLILFLHGFPEFWYAWEAQLREFGGDYFAVAPDLRGFNLSDMPSDAGGYKAKHIVDDLRLLVRHLGYEDCVVVAHDWGGAIAWSMAIAFPQLLRKLVIINSPHPYLFMRALADDPRQKAASGYINWLRTEGSENALAKNDFALMDEFFNRKGQPAAQWYTADVREKYHECWSRGLTGGVNYYRASPLHPPTEDHPGSPQIQMNPDDFRVRVATRIIWGERDTALPAALLDGLDGLVDDLEIERIPDGTHWVIHEQPERINRLLHRFLEQ